MCHNKYFCFILLLAVIFTSCIKSFDPDIKSSDKMKYVVWGQVNRGDSIQLINISLSTNLSKPMVIPVQGCKVIIIDGKGNSYPATDVWGGNYEVSIPESELVPGNSFKVDILVPEGFHIVSDFDQMPDGPEVDSVYYLLKEIPSSNPAFPIRGIQFYLNLNAEKTSCQNFRFDATETWEYTANLSHLINKRICWVTSKVRNIYILTTQNQTKKIYTLYPLHFIDNYSSQRLKYMYSLLINQYSLSNPAYEFWEQVKTNNVGQGGLYESQPLQIRGNMHNLSDTTDQVLGFFGASTKSTKRIFVSDVKGLPIEYVECVIDPKFEPNPECLDCTKKVGGTNIKPYFWPN